jgi:Transposase IS66 family
VAVWRISGAGNRGIGTRTVGDGTNSVSLVLLGNYTAAIAGVGRSGSWPAIIADLDLSAERIHADDTTVPVLAKLKTVTGRIWTYVRDDGPFGGKDPPAAMFYYSRNRAGDQPREHLAGYAGIMQAEAFYGFYDAKGKPAPIIEAACWSHCRRKFFDLATLSKSPIAAEAVPPDRRAVRGRADHQRPIERS